jgi:NADPH:quinone reductase-like Zn-dependent oxidoreductase
MRQPSADWTTPHLTSPHSLTKAHKQQTSMAPTDSSNIPPTMRAWVCRRRGPARSALELASDVPTPAAPLAASSDVLIRVSHVSLQVNSELHMKLMPILPFGGPRLPELELSGEVVAAGDAAPSELREPGTLVAAFQDPPNLILKGSGILAEYVRLPGNNVVRIDGERVDMPAASGIHCSGSTALKMAKTAGVRSGHTVLVNGASGSIGSILVQMCKLRGATVVGVASGGNEAMVRGFGADDVCYTSSCGNENQNTDEQLVCRLPEARSASGVPCPSVWRQAVRFHP